MLLGELKIYVKIQILKFFESTFYLKSGSKPLRFCEIKARRMGH